VLAAVADVGGNSSSSAVAPVPAALVAAAAVSERDRPLELPPGPLELLVDFVPSLGVVRTLPAPADVECLPDRLDDLAAVVPLVEKSACCSE
jgi:hypothetical protein